jgi:IclR family transcriptional regulator, acetate operon repressor
MLVTTRCGGEASNQTWYHAGLANVPFVIRTIRCLFAHQEKTRMVSRVIQIIEQLAVSESSASLADLTRSTGLPKSTLHRLLATLADNGAVAKTGTTYRLGDRLVELIPSRNIRSASALRRLLVPHLTDLHRATGMIVGLVALSAPEVIVIEIIYGNQHRSAALRIPERAPADRTAAGKLLLALRPELPCGYSPEWSAADGASSRLLDEELAGIRVAGIAVGRGEHVPGMSTIAAPIAGRNGKSVAALMICGPDHDAELARATRHLRQAAHCASLTIRCAVGPANGPVELASAGNVRAGRATSRR